MYSDQQQSIAGPVSFDWSQFAFGRGKYRRKTFGFGKLHKSSREYEREVYIRELSILDGGLGCACWDAAIIFARWIYSHQEVFRNKSVIELGSGVGLPGILCGHYSSRTVLTDYIQPVLDNLEYNIELNSVMLDETMGGFRTAEQFSSNNEEDQFRFDEDWNPPKMKSSTSVDMLDWDDPNSGADLGQFDLIIGSELTYSDLSVDSLCGVIDRFLKPGGVFYEVLSDDRDGVEMFIDLAAKKGFECHRNVVSDEYSGNFGTKQRPESYKFFTFYRREDREKGILMFEDMSS